MDAKETAARQAVTYIQNGMVLGLGSGSTATFAIQAIGERVAEGLKVVGVPTSQRSRELAKALQIPLVDLSDVDSIDITIDGADEVDPHFNLIKGGGGALLREKLVACASKEVIIICDESKIKPFLGAFPLPVAIIPFGWRSTLSRLQTICPSAHLRAQKNNSEIPFISDDGLYIIEMPFQKIADPENLEKTLKSVIGVVEIGLFTKIATRVIVGSSSGSYSEQRAEVEKRENGKVGAQYIAPPKT